MNEVYESAGTGRDEPIDKGGGEVKVNDAKDHISRDIGGANSVHTTNERDGDDDKADFRKVRT